MVAIGHCTTSALARCTTSRAPRKPERLVIPGSFAIFESPDQLIKSLRKVRPRLNSCKILHRLIFNHLFDSNMSDELRARRAKNHQPWWSVGAPHCDERPICCRNDGDGVNFLRFSDKTWRLIGEYNIGFHKQLRASDFIALYCDSNLEIQLSTTTVFSKKSERQQLIKVDQKFVGKTAQDFATPCQDLVVRHI